METDQHWLKSDRPQEADKTETGSEKLNLEEILPGNVPKRS